MFSRKSLHQLLIGGLATLLAHASQALPLPDPPYETSTNTSTSSWGGSWNSHISCVPIGSATNVVGPIAVTQSALVHCIVTYPDSPTMEEGDCQLNISYSRAAGLTTSGATQCQANDDGSSTLTDVAYCGNASRGLVVSGTLDCNPTNNPTLPSICKGNSPCIANLDGIGDVPNGQCGTVLPASTEVPLAAGQVLSVSVTTNNSTCTGEVIQAHSSIYTRFCNSGSFDPTILARCLYGTGSNRQSASITGNTTVFLPVRLVILPNTVNILCGGNKDNGDVRFTLYGDENVDVTLIDQSTLSLEGVGINQPCTITDADADGFMDLECSADSCPNLGPALEAQRNADKTVTVDLTGELNSHTSIQGKYVIKTSP
jgi:hypothetical protein